MDLVSVGFCGSQLRSCVRSCNIEMLYWKNWQGFFFSGSIFALAGNQEGCNEFINHKDLRHVSLFSFYQSFIYRSSLDQSFFVLCPLEWPSLECQQAVASACVRDVTSLPSDICCIAMGSGIEGGKVPHWWLWSHPTQMQAVLGVTSA